VHVIDETAGDARFASYIYVTQMVHGAPAPLSSGIVNGAARDVGGKLQISELHVILDTLESDVYSKVRSSDPS
jgi:hypothetical protein